MSSNSTPIATRDLSAISSIKPRRRVLLGALIDGKSINEASAIAGYAKPKQGKEALADLRAKMPMLMESIGLSPECLVDRLHRKLTAQKTLTATSEGTFTDVMEVDDHGVQMDAIKLALNLYGVLHDDRGGGETHLNILINNSAVIE